MPAAGGSLPRRARHATHRRRDPREHVESFVQELLSRWKPATAANRYRALQRFFGFAVEEGEFRTSPMRNMSPPKVPESPPEVLEDGQLRDLLKACDGPGFDDRRDAASSGVHRHRREALGGRRAARGGCGSRSADAAPHPDEGASSTVRRDRQPDREGLDRHLRVRRGHREAIPRPLVGNRGRDASGIRQVVGGGRRRPASDTCTAPVPAHVRPPMARRGRRRGQPDATHRMAQPRDGQPIRGIDGHGPRPGGAPSTVARGQVVRLTIRCKVLDGGQPCGNILGIITGPDF